MRISRKVFVLATLVLLLSSFVAASQGSRKITLHVQTMGHKGKDLLVLQAEITGEDDSTFLITISKETLRTIEREINIENSPVTRIIKHFSIETAMRKNKSFRSFIERYCR